MKPFIRKKLPFILIIVQVILILGLLIYIVPGRYRLYNIVLYDASENFPDNPLIGYAPAADHLEDCENTSLVFITLPFSEWEPEEGVVDTASLEEKYHIQEHREKGRHAVLVVFLTLNGVAQNAVSFRSFLKLFCSGLIARICIRMIFLCQLPVCSF